jgi:AcrR family transcriptional regulator
MPKIVDKEAKKKDIMHAAMEVFSQKGVSKTKMIDIAEKAGIGKGTIYEYYRSKEEIFGDAFMTIYSQTEDLIREVTINQDDPEKKLRRIMELTVDTFFHGGGDFVGIMMDFWSEGIRNKDERILEIFDLNLIYQNYRMGISDILQEGIASGVFREMDTRLTASVIIAALDGLLLQWILDRNIFDPRNATDVLVETYLNGIKKQ